MKKNNKLQKQGSKAIILDSILIFFIIIFSILDSLIFKKTINNYNDFFYNNYDIIIVLLPTIVTIVSISLSLNNEKIYGVTLIEFKSLCGGFYFSFLHMIFVLIGVFVLYAIFKIFNLQFSIIFLECLCIAYAIKFSLQEIPILSRSKTFIKKLLKKRFQKETKNGLFKAQENTIFLTIIQNIVLKEGLFVVINTLEGKNTNREEIIKYLFTAQKDYFTDVLESISPYSSVFIQQYRGIDLLEAIDKGYENVESFLKSSDSYELKSDYYYLLTRLLFLLHFICKELKIEKKESERLSDMISYCHITEHSADNNEYKLAVIIKMAIETIGEGETWFIRYLRDNRIHQMYFFDFYDSLLGVFISMLISHLLKRKILNEDGVESIESFMNEINNSLNSDGSTWRELCRMSLENAEFKDVINSLSILLKYYKLFPNESFYFGMLRNNMYYWTDDDFQLINVFDYWLEFIFISASWDFKDVSLESALEKLEEDEKATLAELLSEKWLEDGKLRDNLSSTFSEIILKEKRTFSQNFYNKRIIDDLVKFHDDFYKKKEEKLDRCKIDDDQLLKISKSIQESFINSYSSFELYDDSLPLNDSDKKCFSVSFYALDFNKLIKRFLEEKNIRLSLISLINEEIKKNIDFMNVDDGLLNDEITDFILKKECNITSSEWQINAYIDNNSSDNAIKLKEIKFESISGIIHGLYWKKGAIGINVKLIDENAMLIRRATDEEINIIIERDYKPFENGLYRFADNNYKNRDFYLTREELKKKIKERLVFVLIPFQYSVKLNENYIVAFNKKANNF